MWSCANVKDPQPEMMCYLSDDDWLTGLSSSNSKRTYELQPMKTYEEIVLKCKKMLGTIDLQKSQILETLRSWALKYGKSKFWLPHCLMYGFDRPIAGNPGGLLTRSRHGGRSTFSWHLSSEWYRWAFDTSFKTIQYLLVDVGGCWWCNMFSLLCIYPLVN